MIKGWLVDTLNVDVVPPSWLKYIIIVGASIVGGFAYAGSGSWITAIEMDLFSMFGVWVVSKVAEPIGLMIVKTLLFILP